MSESPRLCFAVREQFKKECIENLEAIARAIAAYCADHDGAHFVSGGRTQRKMPDWLSQLHPNYLQASKLLLCPADKTGGTPAGATEYKDPTLLCSYRYEFNPTQYSGELVRFDPSPPENYSCREGRQEQLKYFGGHVPIVRCQHHGEQIIKLGYDGAIAYAPDEWENTPECAKAALSFLQTVIRNNPDSWEKEISLESVFDYFKDARRTPDFRVILEGQPRISADALKILGKIYGDEGSRDAAIAAYQQVIEERPDDVKTRLVLAKLYAREKNYAATTAEVEQALRQEPKNLDARRMQIELRALEDAERIQKQFGKADALDLHYLVKMEERLLASDKTLLPTVRKVQKVLQEGFGKRESVVRLYQLYIAMEEFLASGSGAWKQHTTADGLLSGFVFAIAQDSHGVLWLATASGVCQFDGEHFTPAPINEVFDERTAVSSLYIDRTEHFWFGTQSRGLFRWDGENVVNYTMQDGLGGDSIHVITQDADGQMWFGTEDGGLSRYDSNLVGCGSRQVRKFTTLTAADGLAHDDVRAIITDRHDHLWIGTQAGACRYDGETFTTFTEADGLVNNEINAIIEDRAGNFWFGTHNGLSRYDGEQFTNFTKEDGLASNRVSAMLEDRAGNIWITQDYLWTEGVSRYDGRTFTIFTRADGLGVNPTNTVFEDREGSLWFGHSSSGGVTRFNPHALKNYGIQDGLAWNGAISLAQDREGNLWIVTFTGVNKYDGKAFTQPIAEHENPQNDVLDVFVDKKGCVWFCTYNSGLLRYEPSTLSYSAEFVPPKDQEIGEETGGKFSRLTTLNGLAGNCIVSGDLIRRRPIAEDRDGNLWIAAYESGLCRYDGKNLTNVTMADGLPSDAIHGLTHDTQGNVWMCTWGQGVIRYDGEQFITFTQADGLASDYVTSALSDSQGSVWFGTADGLSRYDGQALTKIPGLFGNVTTTIFEDRGGYLWFGTMNNGAVKFSPDSQVFTQITTDDGLPSNFVYDFEEDRAGNIWIATEKGLTRYTPNPVLPLVRIESIVADQTYPDPTAVTLSAGTNHFRVNYRALSFVTRAETMQYFYRLDGYDSTWRGPTHDRSIDYLELAPGAYTFHVKAVKRDLKESEPTSLTLEVVPDARDRQIAELESELEKRNRELERLNAQLHDENLRMSVELAVTEKIQRLILPTKAELKAIGDLDIAGEMIPAHEVGGDYYDVLQQNGRLIIAIGDVTGHGVESGMVMLMTQSIVRGLLESGETDGTVILAALNRAIYQNVQRMDSDKNLTLCLLDYADGEVELTGQHEEMIVVRKNGKIKLVDTIDLGFPIGLDDEIAEFIDRKTVPLAAGDGVVLYTDGITEAENEYKEQYGLERLCEVVKENWSQSADEIRDAVVRDVLSFIGDAEIYDDITLVVLKQR